MFESLHRRIRKKGMAPGTVTYVGRKQSTAVALDVIHADEQGMRQTRLHSAEDCAPFVDAPTLTWINMDGLHDSDCVTRIGELFHLHPLVLEDIVHTGQRPKLDDLGDALFLVLKMLRYDEENRTIEDEQVCFVLKENVLLTFQEKGNGDVFGEVRKRLLAGAGKLAKSGPDYLMYGLIDALVDNYFVVLERMGEDIEEVEEALLDSPTPGELETIHGLRREALFLRRFIWPLREVLAKLEKGGSPLIQSSTIVYLRDLYDHTIQVMDTVETFRDMLSGMLELYLSNVSLKLNETMKVLTMISTIFIPLSFLASLYGMNFKHMPELETQYGYFVVLGVMACTVTGMVLFFRRKGWLSAPPTSQADKGEP
ncbi:MAG: magnesium/cobalt transporter CorA [Humidesulfovibrio sp.]|jgi:magnesium transporter|uniref:magnesium/cobalt transporter CorA n=1 Tax=Humidesulfovibrio sp. TaxID=2910988 RepID=UPI0027341CC7|nr:magnesium/cobalt transporter CorA [Humidesulfovibrio sp.]MDP2847864.1 magnesium/cobalt transporter CorA [Humidesulfovibrio sp.]